MKLPRVDELNLVQKKVLVRADLDIAFSELKTQNLKLKAGEIQRLEVIIPTLQYLNEKRCQIIIIGHRGRPELANSLQTTVENNKNLSLRSIKEPLEKTLGKEIKFIDSLDIKKIRSTVLQFNNSTIFLLENLRFDPREEEDSEEFAKELAALGDFFVNEAFAVSHRKHASIVGIPKYLPHAAGLRFVEEVENLARVLENPQKPLVIIISGVKQDKLDYIEAFSKLADKVLIAGRLPEYIEKTQNSKLKTQNKEKLLVATLLPDKEDITIHSIESFETEIEKAGTIVLAGPIGKYEEEGHRMGTKRVFEAVAKSSAFKLAGGGDTQEAINLLGLKGQFDWISVGGGAMLQFLAKGTLPGIEALKTEIESV